MKNATLLFFVLVLIVACNPSVQQNLTLTEGALIENVQVRGNRAISAETIAANLRTKPSGRIRLATVRRDIQNLYGVGYFDDIRVEETGGTTGGKIVIFEVREKLRYR